MTTKSKKFDLISVYIILIVFTSTLYLFLLIEIKPQHHAGEFGLIGIGSQTVAEG